MRLLCLFIIGCSFFFKTSAQSQTFHLGLKAEFYAYTLQEVSDYKTYSKKFSLSPLPSMYIVISKDLSESISFILRPGFLFRPERFNGLELGLALTHKIYTDNIFLLGGINLHFVKEKTEGNHFSSYSKTVYFIFLGLGHQLTGRFSVDISFHQALNSEFGYTYGVFSSDASGPSKLINMLKFGLSATF